MANEFDFERERDGVAIRGAGDGELVANVERHLAQAHPDLVGQVSREDNVPAAEMSAMGERASTNKRIVLRWAEEVVNRREAAVVDVLFAAEFSLEMPFNPELLRGPQVMKETVAASRLAFSDPALEVDDVLAEGDEFALTYTASGTNDGETIGAPASGESAAWPAEPYGGVR